MGLISLTCPLRMHKYLLPCKPPVAWNVRHYHLGRRPDIEDHPHDQPNAQRHPIMRGIYHLRLLKYSVATLALFSLLDGRVYAQASPTATRDVSLSAFGLLSGVDTGFDSSKNLSLTAGADIGFLPPLGTRSVFGDPRDCSTCFRECRQPKEPPRGTQAGQTLWTRYSIRQLSRRKDRVPLHNVSFDA